MGDVSILVLTFVFLSLAQHIRGSGILIEPKARSTLKGTPLINLNCGGPTLQYTTNLGKCGVCGDAYNSIPQENMVGGTYYPGTIAATYENNGELIVIVRMDPTKKGRMQFRICAHNDLLTDVNQTCLDSGLLPLKNGGNEYVVDEARTATIALILPQALTCDQCVLQWTWMTGVSPSNPDTLRNCADIKITTASTTTTVPPQTTTTITTPTTTPTTLTTTTTPMMTTTSPRTTTTTITTTTTTITTTTTTPVPVITTPYRPITTPRMTTPWWPVLTTPYIPPVTTKATTWDPIIIPWSTQKPPPTLWPWWQTQRPWIPQTTKPQWPWWNNVHRWTTRPPQPRPRMQQAYCYQFMMMCEQMSERPLMAMMCMQNCLPWFCACGMSKK